MILYAMPYATCAIADLEVSRNLIIGNLEFHKNDTCGEHSVCTHLARSYCATSVLTVSCSCGGA
ncbi:hypothetical protein [Anabaena azotica]|uniref:hypothetical protein n=1 Tax=Anabaena azotica TaxID=197653 RepID=UPI00168714C4|nr:hypothetical protein [Anabaena azotica]